MPIVAAMATATGAAEPLWPLASSVWRQEQRSPPAPVRLTVMGTPPMATVTLPMATVMDTPPMAMDTTVPASTMRPVPTMATVIAEPTMAAVMGIVVAQSIAAGMGIVVLPSIAAVMGTVVARSIVAAGIAALPSIVAAAGIAAGFADSESLPRRILTTLNSAASPEAAFPL